MQIENINNAYFVKQNDTLSEIHFRITNDLDEPIDLKVFDRVEIIVGQEEGRYFAKDAELLAGTGEFTFSLADDEVIPSGKLWLEVHMYEGSSKRVAPSKGFYQLRVERAIDELQAEVTTVTLDYFLDVANESLARANSAIKTANEASENADRKAEEAEKQAREAEKQGKYALAQGEYARREAEKASTATQNADSAASKAVTDGDYARHKGDELIPIKDETQKLTEFISTDFMPSVVESIADIDNVVQGNKATSENALKTANEAKSSADTANVKSGIAEQNSSQANETSGNALATAVRADSKSTNAENVSLEARAIAKSSDKFSKDTSDRLDNLLANVGDSNSEVVDARMRANGTVASTLGSHIREYTEHVDEVFRNFVGTTAIQIDHDLNDYPAVHVVVEDGFGIGGFGFTGFGRGKFATPNRVDYLDENRLIVHIPEDFKGTPTIEADGTRFTARFSDIGAYVEIYTRRNY